MTPSIAAELVNGPFGDPALYLDFRFERRAILFDLGDIAALAPRKIMRLTDVFVTHAHMDHFCGFDRLLRLCLGRDMDLRLYGPPGFVDQVEHRMLSYTWNRVENYPNDFSLVAYEVSPAGDALTAACFRSRARFVREPAAGRAAPDGVLLEEPGFRVRAAVLDHGIPCLGLAFEEGPHVNVWRNRLAEFGVTPGPWLKALKEAAVRGAPDDTVIHAVWQDAAGRHERSFPVGELRRALEIVPGERIAYVTDIVYHAENAARVARLAAGADRLFIECVFSDADAAHAERKGHLTARQAGLLARAAGAGSVTPFHFSPRYQGVEQTLVDELEAARSGRHDPAPARPTDSVRCG